MKLRINPTKNQKIILNKWAGSSRFLYNKTIAILTNPKNKTLKSVYDIRDRLCTIKNRKTKKINSFYNNKPWLKECPKSIKQGSIADASSNLKSCFSNLKAKNIKMFNKPFKTKKKEISNGWCFSIEKNNISKDESKLFIYKELLGEIKYYKTKQLNKLIPNKKPEMDCKIQKDRFGDYYLLIPYTCIAKPLKSKIFTNPVSIDPGVRKFLTTFAPNKQESLIMGNRWSTKIMSLLTTLDKMYSEKNKDKQKIKRIRKKIYNLKIELRYKCANFISKEYDLVLMPKLDTGKLSIKATRRLKTKTVRAMLQAGHSKFFDTLKDKCWENGSHFLHVKEDYTSQTCPCCGTLNKCNEFFKCKNCSFSHDRDIIGSLNIMLKAIR